MSQPRPNTSRRIGMSRDARGYPIHYFGTTPLPNDPATGRPILKPGQVDHGTSPRESMTDKGVSSFTPFGNSLQGMKDQQQSNARSQYNQAAGIKADPNHISSPSDRGTVTNNGQVETPIGTATETTAGRVFTPTAKDVAAAQANSEAARVSDVANDYQFGKEKPGMYDANGKSTQNVAQAVRLVGNPQANQTAVARGPVLDNATQKQIVAAYPQIGVAGTPANKAFVAAFANGDRSADSAWKAAAALPSNFEASGQPAPTTASPYPVKPTSPASIAANPAGDRVSGPMGVPSKFQTPGVPTIAQGATVNNSDNGNTPYTGTYTRTEWGQGGTGFGVRSNYPKGTQVGITSEYHLEPRGMNDPTLVEASGPAYDKSGNAIPAPVGSPSKFSVFNSNGTASNTANNATNIAPTPPSTYSDLHLPDFTDKQFADIVNKPDPFADNNSNKMADNVQPSNFTPSKGFGVPDIHPNGPANFDSDDGTRIAKKPDDDEEEQKKQAVTA